MYFGAEKRLFLWQNVDALCPLGGVQPQRIRQPKGGKSAQDVRAEPWRA